MKPIKTQMGFCILLLVSFKSFEISKLFSFIFIPFLTIGFIYAGLIASSVIKKYISFRPFDML